MRHIRQDPIDEFSEDEIADIDETDHTRSHVLYMYTRRSDRSLFQDLGLSLWRRYLCNGGGAGSSHGVCVVNTAIVCENALPLPPSPEPTFGLHNSITKKVPISNDMFSDSPPRDLSNATLAAFSARMIFLLWRYRARKLGPTGRGEEGQVKSVYSQTVRYVDVVVCSSAVNAYIR